MPFPGEAAARSHWIRLLHEAIQLCVIFTSRYTFVFLVSRILQTPNTTPFNGFDVFSLSPEASIQFWFGTDRAGRQILCILLGQRQGPWWSATEKFAMRHVTYTLQPIWHYDPVLLSSFLDGSYLASTSNPFIRIGMPD